MASRVVKEVVTWWRDCSRCDFTCWISEDVALTLSSNAITSMLCKTGKVSLRWVLIALYSLSRSTEVKDEAVVGVDGSTIKLLLDFAIVAYVM